MPKEKIYDNANLFDLEVGWSALGESVQVGLLVRDGRTIADWLSENSPSTDTPPPSGPKMADFTSLWATLDRAQINRMIRCLRKARDESYGRDE